MDRYQHLFRELASRGEGAFVPFITLGDPNPTLTLSIIDTLIEAGADALELGLPFSDPLADGPTIQNANLRAFAAGVTTSQCFTLLTTLRQKYPKIPIGLLMYANLVFHDGISTFYQRCAKAGVDSVLVADVPMEESTPFYQAAQQYGIAPIFVCPPNADGRLLQHIARQGAGYTYLLSRAGVTGIENAPQSPLQDLIDRLKVLDAPPALQGFGISQPCQVRAALEAGASGAISGSAIVKIIEKYHKTPQELFSNIMLFVRSMKEATRR